MQFLKKISLSLLLPIGLLAQEPERYRGPLQLGSLQGHADFSYSLQENDTVFQGPFSLTNSDLKEISQSPVNFFSINGDFQNGVPKDEWKIRWGELNPLGRGELIDHYFRLRIDAKENWTTGEMIEGKADGEWEVRTLKISDSQIADTLFMGHFPFEEGRPNGSFTLRKDSLSLKGAFKNGFAHGEWQLKTSNLSRPLKEWQFDEGRLLRVVLHDDGGRDTIRLTASAATESFPVPLNKDFFNILSIRLRLSGSLADTVEPTTPLSNLTLRGIGYFHHTDSIFDILSGSSFVADFRAKLHAYPLSGEENDALEKLSNSVDEARSVLRDIQEDAQLKLLKLSDEEIAFYTAAASLIEEQFIRPLQSIVMHHEKDLLKFLPREKLLGTIIPAAKDTAIAVAFAVDQEQQMRTFPLYKNDKVETATAELSAAAELGQNMLKALERIEQQLENLAREKNREKQLVEMESSMMSRYDSLVASIDSIRQTSKLWEPGIWISLRELAENRLDAYSEMADDEKKSGAAEELRNCFDQIEKAAHALAEIPQQKKAVQTTYTREVWNPYTFTHMEELVKKRIVNAYNEILLPYFLDNLKEEPNCEMAGKTSTQLNDLFQKMMELRTAETGRLERKLRKADTPEEVLNLFDLDTD